MSEQRYSFGSFEFDKHRRTLRKHGSPVAIGHKCAVLLETLLAAGGKVVSKSELIEAAWQTENIEESNLAVQIAALRKRLGKSSSGNEWVATVQRVGYQFVDADKTTASPVEQDSGAQSQTVLDRPSIAVLPFITMDGDTHQQYLADGITEDVITELSRFRSLSVVARSSSFVFRGQNIDITRVGRELGAQYMVEGSVRRVGNRIRVTAQLIETGSARHIWAEKFDSDDEELFVVQDQLVRTIVGTLIGRLQVSAADQANRKPPASLTAYEYLLRGNALPFDDHRAAIEARSLFNKAIVLDPGYARAYALLADLTYVEWWNEMSASKKRLDQALELARKAVALDESDYTGQGVLGWALMLCQEHDLAEQHHLKAYELNRNRASVLAGLGGFYAYQGKPIEGMRYFERAKPLDPFFEPNWYWRMLGVIQFSERRYDEAISAFSRPSTIPFWGQAYLAACHALSLRITDAGRHAAEVLRLAPEFSIRIFASKEPYKQSADRERLFEGLRAAGLPE
jgi:TolB-like protein/Tfp pilus assembly protein PilF